MTDTAEEMNKAFKLMLRQKIINFIYDKPFNKLREEKDRIILKNSELYGNNQIAVTFRGEMHTLYGHVINQAMHRPVNSLKPELLEDMCNCLNDWNDLHKREIPIINNFLGSVLALSEAPGDYYKILPSAIHEPIKTYFSEFLEVHPAKLTQDQVDTILAVNATGMDMLKKRLLINWAF